MTPPPPDCSGTFVARSAKRGLSRIIVNKYGEFIPVKERKNQKYSSPVARCRESAAAQSLKQIRPFQHDD